ncbi:hypothetical protein WICANDRAFT_77401 [Wickerhamomyces anomalus NRRL Y-366-8]|uniref:Membrane insertase YidC/Oxa/ALB C-terminal domain-containing protein n=1 Tax=Wickerhamomyces anomalus (strain ATCC 58044 / CBS 1984 / NCYC 433 / NRRL Y-366-8) TaxID=683960 RepID=A0A1E3P5J3_WICAA|nr:uncharacterized protein WICANDRAFT_77401 [Wickerhamomyces anomalus NRRL Y-366-8]ODQ60726.1 hypothetical protein WICANDRAFT_77401 [Wickerhamomyces anomalus NRRL Y-366-8]
MLRSSILRSSKAVRIQPLFLGARLNPVNSRFNIQNVRYNSSSSAQQAATEIQKSLPSFDQAAEVVSGTGSQIIGEASQHIGYLQSIGLAKSWWWPPDLIQHVLEIVHVYTGLPWWATIALTTISVRACMFPLYVKSSDVMARNAKIKPKLDDLQAQLYSAADMAESQLVMMKRKKLLQEHGIKNRYLMAPILQLPIAIGFFAGLRGMANANVDGFQNGGILWFQDLTAADPYLGLQCLSAAVIMGFMRAGGETGAQVWTPQVKKILTYLPLISIPATMSLSSGVILYFFVNGLFSVFQSYILKNKSFRKYMNLAEIAPPKPVDPSQPQKGIRETFKEHFEKTRKQAEKKAETKAREDKLKELADQKRKNAEIKIVRRGKK